MARKASRGKKPLEIIFASSEAWPFVKTGGLADVAGALPEALAAEGHDVTLFLPLYKAIDREKHKIPGSGLSFSIPVSARIMDGRALVLEHSKNFRTVFIEQERYFGRAGIYLHQGGYDYPDNLERYSFFCRAVLESLILLGARPDIIHVNDWQTGLLPAYLRTVYGGHPNFTGTRSLITCHNMGYQGRVNPSQWHVLGLSWELFNPGALESYGMINPLKAGLAFSDIITTVSETYSREIMTPVSDTGLDGFLRYRGDRVFGVLNGIDMNQWNPATDPYIPANYSRKSLKGKEACKKELQKKLSLAESDIPVFGVVSRLAYGKGMDILSDSLASLVDSGAQFVLLGSGEGWLEHKFLEMAAERPDRISTTIGFDEGFSHQIQAGLDVLLVPSLYEPCGLTQMYALAYGTAPLVRATGGLNDTVRQYDYSTGDGNGFKFKDYSSVALLSKAREAIHFYTHDREKWNIMVKKGMGEDNSWRRSARKYLELYDLSIRYGA